MKMNRIVLVDPHMTDEIYTPLRFFFRKRRALKKYSYLSELQEVALVSFSFFNSGTIPKAIFTKFPYFIRVPIVFLEYFIWKVLQNEKITFTFLKKSDIAISMLRNASENTVNYLRRKDCSVAWGMSHYHIAQANFKYVMDKDIILADNKLEFLSQLGAQVILCPPVPSERFVNDYTKKRSDKVISTGTIHLYNKQFLGGVKFNEHYTMHPSRAEIFYSKSGIYKKNFSVLSDSDTLYKAQRNYMSQNIVELYQGYKYAFVGSESSGVFALGLLEAMSCGCEIFVEANIAESLGLEDNIHAWVFNGSAIDLEKKYAWIKQNGLCLNKDSIEVFLQEFKPEYIKLKILNHIIPGC